MRYDQASRRAFLMSAPALLSGQARNDTIRIAVIGCGGRGTWNAKQVLSARNTEVIAVCDIDPARLKRFEERVPGKREVYSDFRRMLDRKDIDAVIVATPDHWHVIQALWALRAGKDVYMEKPVGHTIEEGRVLTQQEKKYGRILEIGLQQRSGSVFQEAREIVRSGKIGKVTHVHCINAWNVTFNREGSRGKTIGFPPDSDPPPGVDYDMWLGPAPKRSFNVNHFHWNYVYFWDYSGGMVLGWGVHLIDAAMWIMNAKGPTLASMAAGKYVFDDMRDTPDTAEATWAFPEFVLSYSCRHGSAFPSGGRRVDHGIQFLGTQATLLLDRTGYQIIPEREKAEPVVSPPAGNQGVTIQGETIHHHSFIESVRTRKPPVCSALEGYRSTAVVHLANIAYRTRSSVRWDPEAERVIDNPPAAALVAKKYRAPWSLS